MKTYTFTAYEKSKYHEGDVVHSTIAESLEQAVEKFFIGMKNFGYTKEKLRRIIEEKN